MIDKVKIKREDCKCKCHNDGRIRHYPVDICCEKPPYYAANEQCKCKTDDWHVACSIDPYFVTDGAKITDTKGHEQMNKLQKYTGRVVFGYDENNNSLDIHFTRSVCEWNDGAGIQINCLTESDKDALRQYLENGD